jgi:hypothetical protein
MLFFGEHTARHYHAERRAAGLVTGEKSGPCFLKDLGRIFRTLAGTVFWCDVSKSRKKPTKKPG